MGAKAKEKVELTAELIEAARPDPARQHFMWDTRQRGLGVRITPAGVKSYIVHYSIKGRATRHTIGRVDGPWKDGATLTLTKARKEAARVIGQAAGGEGPAEKKRREEEEARELEKQASEQKTVAEVFSSFEKTAVSFQKNYMPMLKPRTQRLYNFIWIRYLKPVIGDIPLWELQKKDISPLYDAMRPTPYLANRMLAVVSSFTSWANERGLYPDGVYPARLRKTSRCSEDTDKGQAFSVPALGGLGRALAMEPEGSIPAQALIFYFLVGCRPGEALNLRWTDIGGWGETRGRIWHVDGKTGKRDAYLGSAAMAVLARIPRVGEYAFPSGRNGDRPMADLKALWRRLGARCDSDGQPLFPPARLYDLRHTFNTRAKQDLGLPAERARLLVGHKPPKSDINMRYTHYQPPFLLADADRVSEYLAAALRGEVATSEQQQAQAKSA